MTTFAVLISVEAILVVVLVLGQRRIDLLSQNAIVVGAVLGFALFHIRANLNFLSFNHSVIDVALAFVIYLGGVEIGWETISKHLFDVIVYGFGLTLLTIAFVGSILRPFASGSVYFILLAAVAYVPTDPVLAFNQLGRIRLPQRVLTIIQGESVVNDPIALLIFAQCISLLQGGHSHISTTASGEVLSGVVSFMLQLAVALALGAILYLGTRGDLGRRLLRLASPLLFVLIYIGFEHISFSPYLALFILGLFSASGPLAIVDLISEVSELSVIVAVSALIPLPLFSISSAYLVALILFVATDVAFRPLVSIAYFRLRHRGAREGASVGILGLKGSLSLVVATETYNLAASYSQRVLSAGVVVALSFSLLVKGELSTKIVARLISADKNSDAGKSQQWLKPDIE